MGWVVDKVFSKGNKSCHLIEEAKDKTLGTDRINESVEHTDRIYESDKFDVSVCKCKDCDQLYINCLKEYNMADGEDDYWTFWVPATADDIENMKKANILAKYIGEFIAERSHICWGPSGKVYWQEGGNQLAYTIFLPI